MRIPDILDKMMNALTDHEALMFITYLDETREADSFCHFAQSLQRTKPDTYAEEFNKV